LINSLRSYQSKEDILKLSPAGLGVLYTKGQWVYADHLRLLNRLLLKVVNGDIKRLIVSSPPRHGKSMMISQFLPAWYIGTYPEKKIILATYEADFSASWGRKARDVLEWSKDLFGVKLREDSLASYRWETEAGGGMFTAGVRGAITGKGANILIIDDPVKNSEEARSKTIREKIWDWFLSTAYTRLEPDGAIIIVMSRWHFDDLAGRCIEELKNENWLEIKLPAIAVEDEDFGVLKRKKGDPLWKERFPLERLEEIKRSLGNYWWNALYQQSPSPEEGGVIKREYFRYFREEGEYFVLEEERGERAIHKNSCIYIQTIDLAISQKENSDFTVIGTFAISREGDLLVLDMFRGRVDFATQKRLIKEYFKRYKPSYIGVESVAYQLAMVQELRREGLPVKELRAKGDKVGRVLSVATRYEAGKVFHKLGAIWLDDFEDEILRFPNGEHDDMVDVLSYAGIEAGSLGEGLPDEIKNLLKGVKFYE